MLDAISSTTLALLRDELRLQSISQNISNMQTPGYKHHQMDAVGTMKFDDYWPIDLNTARQSMRTSIQHTQGTLHQSNDPHQFALAGDGYFEIQTNAGVFYTRRGDFHVNEQGELATATGGLLLGQSGAIRVDDGAFSLDASGAIWVDHRIVDRIHVVQFSNPNALVDQGQGLYKSDEPPETAPNVTHVLQGYLEQSNVKSIDEMMDMVKLSRHFEATQRIMHTADGLLSSAIHKLGEQNV